MSDTQYAIDEQLVALKATNTEIAQQLLALEERLSALEEKNAEIDELNATVFQLEERVSFLEGRERVIFPIASQVVQSMINKLADSHCEACYTFMTKKALTLAELYCCVAGGCYIPIGNGYKLAINDIGSIVVDEDPAQANCF
jgi:hypothetical protein